MAESAVTLDLRSEPASRVQSAAFYTLKSLTRGGTIVLLTADEPSLMMQSLDLQLRHNLAWRISASAQGWRVEVQHRADVAPQDVLDLLTRDHKRLDALLAQAMQLVNQGDIPAATPLLNAFAAALTRHVEAEDKVLAPSFGVPEERNDAPATIMQREHHEILAQLEVIAESLAEKMPQAGEIGAFCAILSGTLAKHEYREETNLFPQWRRALKSLPENAQTELLARVSSALLEPVSIISTCATGQCGMQF